MGIRKSGVTADGVRVSFHADGTIGTSVETVDRGRNVSIEAADALHADLGQWTWSTLPGAMKALRAAEKKGVRDVDGFKAALRKAQGRRMTAEEAAECEGRVAFNSELTRAARRSHLDHCRRPNCPKCT